MSTPSSPRHFPVTLSHSDRDQTVQKAKQIVVELRPEWKDDPESLKCEFFTEGITNTILCVWNNRFGSNDRILLRIYGEKTELVIDRTAEQRNMVFLNRHGCAPPLYGTFENGVIYGFVPGRVLNLEDVRDPHISELIAQQVAKMHAIDYVNAKKSSGNESMVDGEAISKEPALIPKIKSFIENAPEKFDDPNRQKKFSTEFPSKDQLLWELESIREKIGTLRSPVVFCHNDLLIKNLILDKEKDKVFFIDYEYADFNYQAYDIADHFCEFAGVENPDYSLFPDEQYQKPWLKTYLKYFREYTNGIPPSDRDVEELYVQVNVFASISHFYWAVWCMIQARYSTIHFDFLQYGIDRMQEYFKHKNRTWSWTIPK